MSELQVEIVAVQGSVAPQVQAYARHKISQLAKLAPGPVLLAAGEPGRVASRRSPPTQRPVWFPRPVEERAVVRHKRLALEPVSVAEAALDMDLLDYDFYLFLEAETGQDAVAWRRPDGGLGLAMAGGQLPDLTGCTLSVRPAPPPPRLTLEEATGRLDLTGEPFVFFLDPTTRRGGIAYRRSKGRGPLAAGPNRWSEAPGGRGPSTATRADCEGWSAGWRNRFDVAGGVTLTDGRSDQESETPPSLA